MFVHPRCMAAWVCDVPRRLTSGCRHFHLPATHLHLARAQLRLELLDPRLVLERGYAWLTAEDGRAITTVQQLHPGQALVATLADGDAPVTVSGQPRSR